jgi:hypothetical protein
VRGTSCAGPFRESSQDCAPLVGRLQSAGLGRGGAESGEPWQVGFLRPPPPPPPPRPWAALRIRRSAMRASESPLFARAARVTGFAKTLTLDIPLSRGRNTKPNSAAHRRQRAGHHLRAYLSRINDAGWQRSKADGGRCAAGGWAVDGGRWTVDGGRWASGMGGSDSRHEASTERG